MVEFPDSPKTHSKLINFSTNDSWLPYVGTALSMVICYIKIIAGTILPVLGAGLAINPHIQAVLMWLLGAFVVLAIYREQQKHGEKHPFYTAVLGLFLMLATLYLYYDVRLLFSSYILLLIAAFLNQNAIHRKLNKKIREQSKKLEKWNNTLKTQVEEKVFELNRIGQLKRFLSPEIVDLVVSDSDNSLLQSHRCYVAALFCDLRGFTSFSESTEPEEVIEILKKHHQLLGNLVLEHGGTIGYRAGDGLMVIFNDPYPCEKPVEKAIYLAFAMQAEVGHLNGNWLKSGYNLGFGIGISAGYATLGVIGDDNYSDYTAIGNVINLASRLCDKAKDGEILLSKRAYLDVEGTVAVKEVNELKLKGFSRTQDAFIVNSPT